MPRALPCVAPLVSPHARKPSAAAQSCVNDRLLACAHAVRLWIEGLLGRADVVKIPRACTTSERQQGEGPGVQNVDVRGGERRACGAGCKHRGRWASKRGAEAAAAMALACRSSAEPARMQREQANGGLAGGASGPKRQLRSRQAKAHAAERRRSAPSLLCSAPANPQSLRTTHRERHWRTRQHETTTCWHGHQQTYSSASHGDIVLYSTVLYCTHAESTP